MMQHVVDNNVMLPNTKILEGGTRDEIRIFEALFNGSWPNLKSSFGSHKIAQFFGRHTVQNRPSQMSQFGERKV
jgi:hypothetical protein